MTNKTHCRSCYSSSTFTNKITWGSKKKEKHHVTCYSCGDSYVKGEKTIEDFIVNAFLCAALIAFVILICGLKQW